VVNSNTKCNITTVLKVLTATTTTTTSAAAITSTLYSKLLLVGLLFSSGKFIQEK
jgi:hypothetical protein